MKHLKYNLFILLSLPVAFALSLIIDMGWFLGSAPKLTRLSSTDREKIATVEEYLNREDWMIAFGPFGQTDLNFYHQNSFRLNRYIRRADVVFMGNSRSQFAYDRFTIEGFFKQHNINFHHLGFGCGESISVELNLLRRRRATPKVLVLNVDNNFFQSAPSKCATGVLAGTDEPRRRIFQSRTIQVLMFYTNKLLAGLNLHFDAYVPENTLYRQAENGLWVTDVFVHPRNPYQLQKTTPRSCKPLSPLEKKMINAWMKQIKTVSPDVLIVNTLIPKPGFCGNRLREVSEFMNVPYFQVDQPNELTVFDQSHLSKESAELFTREFANFFETQILPTVNLSNGDK